LGREAFVSAFSFASFRRLKDRRVVGAVVLVTAILAASPSVKLPVQPAHPAGSEAEATPPPRPAAVPHLDECRRAIVEHRFDAAVHAADRALACEPNRTEALLLRGGLLILRTDFAGACVELRRYLQQRPQARQEVEEAQALFTLCRRPRPWDVNNLLAIAAVFERMRLPDLAEGLLRRHGGFSLAVQRRLGEIRR
jgi:hypothetical protein